jgi:hypothetical protein
MLPATCAMPIGFCFGSSAMSDEIDFRFTTPLAETSAPWRQVRLRYLDCGQGRRKPGLQRKRTSIPTINKVLVDSRRRLETNLQGAAVQAKFASPAIEFDSGQ